jgi:large subunit ribosomal protein L6
MSRVAKNPISIPPSVEVKISGLRLDIKGPKGSISGEINSLVSLHNDGQSIRIKAKDSTGKALEQSGTARAIIQNMVTGVASGFERKLVMVGVGYRAQAKGSSLSLSLGYSHPIEFDIPRGVTAETPSQTEILIKGCDKQLVGQVAANIRAFRSPEPYKGKGVRYLDEVVARKEAKKK